MTSTRLTRSQKKAIEKEIDPETSLGQLSSLNRTVSTALSKKNRTSTLPSSASILKQEDKDKDREFNEDLSSFEENLLGIKRQSKNMVQVEEMTELDSRKKKEAIRYSEEEKEKEKEKEKERKSNNLRVKRSRMEEEEKEGREDHFTWEESSVSTIYEADNGQINQIEKRKEYIGEEKSRISDEENPFQLEGAPLMLRKQNSYFKNWKLEKKEEFYLWKKMIKCCGLFGREYRLFFKYHYWPRKKENFKSRTNVGIEKRNLSLFADDMLSPTEEKQLILENNQYWIANLKNENRITENDKNDKFETPIKLAYQENTYHSIGQQNFIKKIQGLIIKLLLIKKPTITPNEVNVIVKKISIKIQCKAAGLLNLMLDGKVSKLDAFKGYKSFIKLIDHMDANGLLILSRKVGFKKKLINKVQQKLLKIESKIKNDINL